MPDGQRRGVPRLLYPTYQVGPNQPPPPDQPGALWYDTSADYGLLADAPVGAVRLTSVQSLSSQTTTVMSFNAVDRDTHGFWSSGQPTRLTIPPGLGGLYLISCYVRANLTSGAGILTTRRNGADTPEITDFSLVNEGRAQAQYLMYLNAGEYVEMTVFLSAAASTGHASSAASQNQFRVTRLGGIPGPQGIPGGVIERATSFPAAPYVGQRICRTDIRGGMDFEWDGTYWLSVQQFDWSRSFEGVTTTVNSWLPLPRDLGLFLTTWDWTYLIATTHNATDLWIGIVKRATAANVQTDLSAQSSWNGSAPTTWQYGGLNTINALHDMTAYPGLSFQVWKSSNPGPLYAGMSLRYRLRAT